jgi:hypothetical protein
MLILIADFAHSKFFLGARDVFEVGIAFGFGGLLVGSIVEAVRAFREDRSARWGEPTLWGTVLGGFLGSAVELFSKLGIHP